VGALRLCIERILPPCRERTVKFALSPIESAAGISVVSAVTATLAGATVTLGEAATIAAVVTPWRERSIQPKGESLV